MLESAPTTIATLVDHGIFSSNSCCRRDGGSEDGLIGILRSFSRAWPIEY